MPFRSLNLAVIYSTVSSALFCSFLIGEQIFTSYLAANSVLLYRVLVDSFVHFCVGCWCWALIRHPGDCAVALEILIAGVFSSIIDLDHVVEAKSIKLQDLVTIHHRSFLHHFVTIPIAFILLQLLSKASQILALKYQVLEALQNLVCKFPHILIISWTSHQLRDSLRRAMSKKAHHSCSDTSSSNEESLKSFKESGSSPCKTTSPKRKSESNVNLPSTTNQSISMESFDDLNAPVSTEKGNSNCDSKSPPAKKRRESNSSNDTFKPQVRTRWRIWEKQRLVEAFEEYTNERGIWLDHKPPNLELCEWIMSKFPEDTDVTPENIQTFLVNAMKKEQQRRFCNDYPIDKWIEIIDAASPKENNVAKQLELIMTVAKQEPSDGVNLPSFDESLPQPDYEAIYDYLSKVFTDKPLPELSPIDSLVVEDLMQSLVFQVESLNDGELRKSLRQVYLHFAQEPDEEQENDHEELRRSLIHSITVLNPLGLNAQSIVPVPPK